MSLNNYVDAGDIFEIGERVWIFFQWGFVRELQYQFGDQINWYDGYRPPEASGTVLVPGIYFKNSNNEEFYCAIRIINDVITDYFIVSKSEYVDLMENAEKLLNI